MLDESKLYVFFHVSKTGGTSFVNHMLALRDEHAPRIPLLNSYQQQLARENNQTYWTDLPLPEKCNAQFIAGHHAGLRLCEGLREHKVIRYLTVFREPSSRYVSVFNYQKHKGVIEPDTSPVDYFQKSAINQSQLNFYLRNFLNWDEAKIRLVREPQYQDALLEEAVAGLDHFFFIGLHESYKQDMLSLTRHLDLPPISQSYHVAGKDITRHIKISDQIASTLMDAYPPEYRFYEQIKTRILENDSCFFDPQNTYAKRESKAK